MLPWLLLCSSIAISRLSLRRHFIGSSSRLNVRSEIKNQPASQPTHFSQYADDTTIQDTDRDAAVAAAAKCEAIFAQDDLRLNLTKTQFVTPSKDDDACRKTKLVGRLLGCGSDIENCINAANRAFGTIAWKRHTIII